MLTVLLIFLSLITCSVSATLLPTNVPEHIAPFNQPIEMAKIDQYLQHYCSPIGPWNKGAYALCLESGANINQALLLSEQYQCNKSKHTKCQAALVLYQNNFRLWQGSVDNVQRAKGYNLARTKAQTSVETKVQTKVKDRHVNPIAPKTQHLGISDIPTSDEVKQNNKQYCEQSYKEYENVSAELISQLAIDSASLANGDTELIKSLLEREIALKDLVDDFQDQLNAVETKSQQQLSQYHCNQETLSHRSVIVNEKIDTLLSQQQAIYLAQYERNKIAQEKETQCLQGIKIWEIENEMQQGVTKKLIRGLEIAVQQHKDDQVRALLSSLDTVKSAAVVDEQTLSNCIDNSRYINIQKSIANEWQKILELELKNKDLAYIYLQDKKNAMWSLYTGVFFGLVLCVLVVIIVIRKRKF